MSGLHEREGRVTRVDNALTTLLSVCVEMSPTREISDSFFAIAQRMKDANEPTRWIVESIVGALHDGLSKGNWPHE